MATVGLSRRSFLACCTALGAASLNTRRVFAQNDQMRTTVNQWPWTGTRDAVACNYALGHLGHNLRQRLTIEGRIHAETYISAVGAIAGYAAQRTLFAETPPVVGVNINRVAVASGEQYWFGDTLNYMLVPKTQAEGNRCVWSLALGGAADAGIQSQQVPKLEAIFQYIASTIGGPNGGKSSVSTDHQPHLPARELLKALWPTAATCFSGKFPNADREYGAAPIAWWSAIAAQASGGPIRDIKDVLPPGIALTLLMESAIYCSKLDQSKVEGT
jgi:hypothetical protein